MLPHASQRRKVRPTALDEISHEVIRGSSHAPTARCVVEAAWAVRLHRAFLRPTDHFVVERFAGAEASAFELFWGGSSY